MDAVKDTVSLETDALNQGLGAPPIGQYIYMYYLHFKTTEFVYVSRFSSKRSLAGLVVPLMSVSRGNTYSHLVYRYPREYSHRQYIERTDVSNLSSERLWQRRTNKYGPQWHIS